MPLWDFEQIILAYRLTCFMDFYGFPSFIILMGHAGQPSSLLYKSKTQKGSQSLSEN